MQDAVAVLVRAASHRVRRSKLCRTQCVGSGAHTSEEESHEESRTGDAGGHPQYHEDPGANDRPDADGNGIDET
jgi:hypothetical protein